MHHEIEYGGDEMSGETTKQKDNSNEKGKKGLVIVCIAAAVIIIVLLGVIIFMIGAKSDGNGISATMESEKRPMVVLDENAEEIAEQILNQTEPEGVPLNYQVTMNSTWEFENGEAESRNAYVANSKNNETAVYFDVIRNDTQDTIYQSPVIPIGQELSSITLDEDLEAGNYECTLIYHLIDDEQNTLTTVNMWLMIIIEN